MKKVRSKTVRGRGLSPALMAESQAVAALTDDQINTADPDAPEVTD